MFNVPRYFLHAYKIVGLLYNVNQLEYVNHVDDVVTLTNMNDSKFWQWTLKC